MKKAKRKNLIMILIGAVIIVWAVLFFTGSGVLVSASERKSGLGTILVCKYLTGTEIIRHEHLKTNLNFLGYEACPRIVKLG